MKKCIFLSILAVATVASCTKSEIIDTNSGNEQIGFHTYLGRDAQTKATEATATTIQAPKGGGIGMYGFYTGGNSYVGTEEAKLLTNENLYYDGGWKYESTRYWTNNSDKYTFLAYAPYGKSYVVASQASGSAPVVEYTVPSVLTNQVDLIYSNNNKNVTKTSLKNSNGESVTSVPFQFQHALARLSVNAKAKMYDKTTGAEVTTPAANQEYDYLFTITNISITGEFNDKGVLNLSTGAWDSKQALDKTVNGATTKNTTYDLTGAVSTQLNGSLKDFTKGNYLMMIPTTFSSTKTAALTIKYKITYAGATSSEIEKTVYVSTDFLKGNAYAINLTLSRDESNAISFDVDTVSGWTDGGSQNL